MRIIANRLILVTFFCTQLNLPQALVANEKVFRATTHTLQEKNDNIQWVEDLNWQQITQKAQIENKYIFVHCYTTSCATCDKMHDETFKKKKVGELFNDKFIAVKIQMNVAKNDASQIKNWYEDAERIKKDYFVFSFPTLLFFNPNGELVEKVTGFTDENKLMSIARAALTPGKKFIDPYIEFLELKDQYYKGIKSYQHFPYMISVARKTGQRTFAHKLEKELHQHLLTLSTKELLKREYIQFIKEYESIGSKNNANNLSKIFFKEGKKVDMLMQRAHYARRALNEMIRRGYVAKFLDRITGKGLKQSEKETMGLHVNVSIPWDSLYNDIANHFNREIAEQNVLWAKIWYYDYYGDPRTLSHFIAFTKKYGIEALSMDRVFINYHVNHIAWFYCAKIECDTSDSWYILELLKNNIEHTVERAIVNCKFHPYFEYVDTYAVLLHKVGEHKKAVDNQQLAIDSYLHCGGGIRYDKRHQEMLDQLNNMQDSCINFSGVWLLNPDKTKFNETPGRPAATTLLVEHKAEHITFQRNDRRKEQLKIDSTAFAELIDEDKKIKVSIKLTPDKKGLIETRRYTYLNGNTSIVAAQKTRIWTLSEDKKTLTIQEHIETTREGLGFDMLLIYERK